MTNIGTPEVCELKWRISERIMCTKVRNVNVVSLTIDEIIWGDRPIALRQESLSEG